MKHRDRIAINYFFPDKSITSSEDFLEAYAQNTPLQYGESKKIIYNSRIGEGSCCNYADKIHLGVLYQKISLPIW